MQPSRVRTRIFLGLVATACATFALYRLYHGDAVFSVLILTVVIALVFLAKDEGERSIPTVLAAGLLTFAAVAAWWPLLERLVQR